MVIDPKQVSEKMMYYRANPVAFFTEVLDVKPENVWDMMEIMACMVRDGRKVAIKAGHSVSKALDIDTPILTSSGMKPIKDVHVGDQVFGENGSLTNVIEESEINEEESYVVKFDDGAEIIAHKGHLWNVHDFVTRKAIRRTVKKYPDKDYRNNWASTRTVNTEWISKNLTHHKQNNVSIPICKPVSGTKTIRSPYTVGLWLGDGTRNLGQITIGDQDKDHIIAQIESEGYIVRKQPSQKYGYSIGGNRRKIDSLRRYLRELGILNDKHFPEWFIFLDYETKIKVVQGYLDADGFKLAHGGSAALGTTDKRLYDSFIPLLASTGVKIFTSQWIMQYKGLDKVVYKLNFSPEYQPFTIKRKKIKTSKAHQCRKQARVVIECAPIGKRKVKCISVDSENKLYLCGNHLVPTHNTYTMARIALWFLYCYPPATVITTAPTHSQVEELLWREIREAHANAKVPLGGKPTNTKLDLQSALGDGDVMRWFAFGFSTRPDQGAENATKMQGFHNEHVLVIFDEADGILPAIWRSADALLTSEGAKLVAVGNPLKPTGDFAECFKDEAYSKLTISVLDTPNYKEGREVIHGLSGREYESDMRKKWGVDSDMYKSRVLGQIPDSDPESIVAVSWYERAEGAVIHDVSGIRKRFVSVDVADGGNDETVVKGWKAGKNTLTQTHEWRYPGKRADEIDSHVIRNVREIDGNAIVYDDDGAGRILGGLLRGILGEDSPISVIPFNGGAPAFDDETFTNRRAEGHFAMHVAFKDNTISVAKGNEKAKRDVTSVRWSSTRKGNRHGKIDVEAKIDLKKRMAGESPDDGDSIMMACACVDEVKAIEKHDIYTYRRTKNRKPWMAA